MKKILYGTLTIFGFFIILSATFFTIGILMETLSGQERWGSFLTDLVVYIMTFFWLLTGIFFLRVGLKKIKGMPIPLTNIEKYVLLPFALIIFTSFILFSILYIVATNSASVIF